MNENARKWVEALRSGEYQQCTDALKSANSFCCLGVACDLYERETGNVLDRDGDDYSEEYDGELPDEVKRWLGMKNRIGILGERNPRENLIRLNDDGYTFTRIADAIEKHQDTLFVEGQ